LPYSTRQNKKKKCSQNVTSSNRQLCTSTLSSPCPF